MADVHELFEPDPRKRKSSGVEARWPGRLGGQFVPVSSYFLQNYHRLKPHKGARGLNSTEVMVLIHLLDHKWDERAPFPTMKTIAKRMDLSVRQVRNAVASLEKGEYLRREASKWGGPNRYHFEGLWRALEQLMDRDEAEAEDETTTTEVEP